MTDLTEWSDRAGAIAYAADLLLWLLYYALMESSPLQATLGKMALSIRVTDMAGQRIQFSCARSAATWRRSYPAPSF